MPSIRRKVKSAATPGELGNPQAAKPWWRLMLVNPQWGGISEPAVQSSANLPRSRQAAKGFDGLTFFIYRTLLDAKVGNAEEVSRKIKTAFVEYPDWKRSEAALRELRKKVTFAVYGELDDLDVVTRIVDELFTLLEKANRI